MPPPPPPSPPFFQQYMKKSFLSAVHEKKFFVFFLRALMASSGGGGGTCPSAPPPPCVRHWFWRLFVVVHHFQTSIFFETTGPFKAKPCGEGTKVRINGPSHMTKMGAMPIYGSIMKVKVRARAAELRGQARDFFFQN